MPDELQKIADLLQQINHKIEDLPANLKIATKQIFVNKISEFSNNLGLMTAGEFRAGNGKEPEHGFTGTRMVHPAVWFNGRPYHLFGVDTDVFQIGWNSQTGQLDAGDQNVTIGKNGITFAGGDGILDSTGITLNRLNYSIIHNATNEGNTRTSKISMTTLTGSAVPVLSIEFGTPITSELCLNGGAELNAFTNWTKTKEIRGAWSVVTSPVYGGTYAFAWTPTTGASLGILTSDRIVVDDAKAYRASGALYNSTAVDDGYGIIYINWYDATSAGNWLRMDVLGRMEFTTTGWAFYDESKTPPTGALSAEFVIVIGDVTNE